MWPLIYTIASKLKEFSRLKVVTYIIHAKMIGLIHQKWCKIETTPTGRVIAITVLLRRRNGTNNEN